jgi:Family of unknown function (DUF5682)
LEFPHRIRRYYIRSTICPRFAQDLPSLTRLLDRVLLANLHGAIPTLMTQLQAVAALTSDTLHFMNALPPLANILRYGDVRQTDTSSISIVVDGLITRLCIGLPNSWQVLDNWIAGLSADNFVAVLPLLR